MARQRVYWLPPSKQNRNLREVFNAQGIFEIIFLIKRQIRGGNKTRIPDIVGLDNDAKRFEMSQPGIVYAVKKGEKTAKENNYQLPE